MEFFNTIRARGQSRTDGSHEVERREDFNYAANFYKGVGIDYHRNSTKTLLKSLYTQVDSLVWTAVHYVDGPMRPYMEKDPMFAKFCEKVESFEALFRADTAFEAYRGRSKGTPSFIRHYLHMQIEKDLDWLDTEFRKSERRSLETSLREKNLNLSSIGVGIVLSLATHLLQLIPLYGPTDGPDDGFYYGNTDHASGDNNGGAEYRSSELVMKSIGNEPRFVWDVDGRDAKCYLAVSHKSPGSLDRCWLNPDYKCRSIPEVKIDPVFRGKHYRGKTEDDGLDSDGQVIEEYDSPEKCLCAFYDEATTSAILCPSKEKDPAAHEGCLMMKKRSVRSSVPIAHSEMYKLQASRNARNAKKWKALCQNYEAKSRRPSMLSRIRSTLS
ncbi:hypothetical protein F4801DRAFT_581184 [Xylaria longipes]|nr:hypothetical protein F4801DRAFT_581184 [Xylaria longipes]